VDAGTGAVTLLPAIVTAAAWSPDGAQLCGVDPTGAFVVATTTSAEVRVVAHGLEPGGPGSGSACAWRPRPRR